MRTYNTLEEIYKDAQPHQVTAQELLNERTHTAGNWGDIRISEELKTAICARLVEIFGGQQHTRERIYRNLMRERRQNWGLSRVVIEKYGEAYKLHYIAGQDMTEEVKQIRKELK